MSPINDMNGCTITNVTFEPVSLSVKKTKGITHYFNGTLHTSEEEKIVVSGVAKTDTDKNPGSFEAVITIFGKEDGHCQKVFLTNCFKNCPGKYLVQV